MGGPWEAMRGHILFGTNFFDLWNMVYLAVIHDQYTILARVGIHNVSEFIDKPYEHVAII